MLAVGLVIFFVCTAIIDFTRDRDPSYWLKALLVLGWFGSGILSIVALAIWLWRVAP